MRELDRDQSDTQVPAPAHSGPGNREGRARSVAIVGPGRCGALLAAAFRAAGLAVDGPLPRNATVEPSVDAILICTPDSEITRAAESLPGGIPVGHCCGAHGPELLGGSRPSFALHPLMTITHDTRVEELKGAWCAIDSHDPIGCAIAEELAAAAGLEPLRIEAANRSRYHAAASIASNFLVTLEAFAEQLAATAGLPREALVPLAEASLRNWSRHGSKQALTGPVARGDDATVALQRQAVAESTPDHLGLFDALCEATRRLAAEEAPA